ncbi:CRTAC1 family protein [Kordiimonas pumila]|uniref:CRTAC1 family protein n=1 Tax=Kordiimonas pumila TaxID=2161677 RepID=A0ABV7D4L8_9PROT|nr:CRTAC1 family protein [Kordiimonas pumila]
MTKSFLNRFVLLSSMALGVSACANSLSPTEIKFTSVQTELFATPGALSNAWGDYDNDGDLDFVVTFGNGEIRLFQNNNNVFKNVGAVAGLPTEGPQQVRSAAWGDYDGDGDLDLYVGTQIRPLPSYNTLYRNDQGTKFVAVSDGTALALENVNSRQASMIDYDGDGDLDIFVPDRSGPNHLLQNHNGTFTDVSESVGFTEKRHTVGACWFDMDEDGDLDLFTTNMSGDNDALYENTNGTFSDIAAKSDIGKIARTTEEGGVGCTVGDFDNDGHLDLFVPTYGADLLYRNVGNGIFKEIAAISGITGANHMVGASWADYDNDGDLDLYVAGYMTVDEASKADDRLYENENGKFTNILTADSPLNASDHGIQWVDFDNDGDLDVSLTEGYPEDGSHPLLRSEMPLEGRQNSLKVLVLDSAGNYTKAGSEVRIFDAKGNILATRLVSTGDGYNSQSAVPVHFGLKDTAPVKIEVSFLVNGKRVPHVVDAVDPLEWTGKAIVIKQP